jgi:uroporphyrinogen decarboxylase
MPRLREYIERMDRTPVMPLIGYPATRLTQTSIKLNEFNWGVHAWSLHTLYRKIRPDAVFTLMDLAVEASGIGLQVRFPLFESPSIEIHPVETEEDLDQFKAVDILKDGRADAFVQTIRELDRLLPPEVLRGAYVTGPFTLAGLLCGARDIAMNVMLKPDLVRRTVRLATSVVTRYALALEEAGADLVMILDPTAVILGPEHFSEFAGGYVSILSAALQQAASVYHVCGDTTHLLDEFAALDCDALSLGSELDLVETTDALPEDLVLMGNINPVEVLLQGDPETVRRRVTRALERMAGRSNFILSTGCDVPAEAPFENIQAFMTAAMDL